MRISGLTRLTGIIGGPEQVPLSLSPAIHNAAFEALDMDWIYLPFGVAPDLLQAAMRGLAAVGIRGMNVTMPHKVAAMELTDELSEEAAKIGAINTVEVRGDLLVGHNTDGDGLVRFLQLDAGADLTGRAVIVMGAGGSARAVVAALAAAGVAEITVASRDVSKAETLEPLAAPSLFHGLPLEEEAERLLGEADIVINATPLGQKREEPVLSPERIRADAVVVDLVYKPPVTPLLEAARARGAIAHSGLGMLLHQAALSFQIWTGVEPPMEVMSAAALAQLAAETSPRGEVETV